MKKTIMRNLTVTIISICMSALFLGGCGDSTTETTDNGTANQVAENQTDANTAEHVEDENQEADAQESDLAQAEETDTQTEGSDIQTEESGLELGTYPDGTSPELSDVRVRLTIDGEEVIIRLYQNTAVDAFMERLPLENLNFFDLSGIEKPAERPEEAYSIAEETPGYDPVTGEMVIYRPWGNFTIFYGDFRHSDELVPLGIVESGLDIVAGQTEDFTGTMEVVE